MLLLEDFQWAEESLSLLKDAVRLLADRPIMIIGTYRNDEHPHLPNDLPGMQHLALARLSTEWMTELSVAILGEGGCQPQVLALLERET